MLVLFILRFCNAIVFFVSIYNTNNIVSLLQFAILLISYTEKKHTGASRRSLLTGAT